MLARVAIGVEICHPSREAYPGATLSIWNRPHLMGSDKGRFSLEVQVHDDRGELLASSLCLRMSSIFSLY